MNDENENAGKPELAIGAYRVGLEFNPSGNPNVNELKQLAAKFINAVDWMTNTSQNPEVKRLGALAMTHAEDAAMWAVKAVTKPDR